MEILTLLIALLNPPPIIYEAHTEPYEIIQAEVTAYNADVLQTDDRPRETASGEEVYPGGVACPSRYPFGTRVEILEKEYTCNDVMNARYRDGNYFDIYMESEDKAWDFGRQQLLIKVYVR